MKFHRNLAALWVLLASLSAVGQQNPGKAVQQRLSEQSRTFYALYYNSVPIGTVDAELLRQLSGWLHTGLGAAEQDINDTDFKTASEESDQIAVRLKSMKQIIDEDSRVSLKVLKAESKKDLLPDMPQPTSPSNLNGRQRRALLERTRLIMVGATPTRHSVPSGNHSEIAYVLR